MSYEKFKSVKAVIALLAIAAFIYILNFHCTLVNVLIYTAVTAVLFFTLRIVENRNYPQWHKLCWNSTVHRIIWGLSITALILLLPKGTFKPLYIVIWGLLFPWLEKSIKDAYYARKYHLDEVSTEDFRNEEKCFSLKYGSGELEAIRENVIRDLMKEYPDAGKKLGLRTKEFISEKEK